MIDDVLSTSKGAELQFRYSEDRDINKLMSVVMSVAISCMFVLMGIWITSILGVRENVTNNLIWIMLVMGAMAVTIVASRVYGYRITMMILLWLFIIYVILTELGVTH